MKQLTADLNIVIEMKQEIIKKCNQECQGFENKKTGN